MITIIPFADHEIGFECVNYLLECEKKGQVKVPFVVTTQANDNSWWPSIKTIANNKEIKVFEEISSFEDFIEIDYFLLLSWKYLMNEKWLTIPRYNTINLHYSLLPKYRGTNPINWVVINGEQTTGITFHEVNSKLDEGQVIKQSKIDIKPEYSLKEILYLLNSLAYEQFKLLIVDLLNGNLTYTKQPDSSEYYSKLDFNRLRNLDLNQIGTLGDHLNLLKGLSFDEENPMAYSNIDEKNKLYYYLKIIKK